jgi:serine/threonine protein kinase
VLEYLSGGELYEEICDKEVYSEDEARKIVSPIIDSIRYLHECGIVHRDLKVLAVLFSHKTVSFPQKIRIKLSSSSILEYPKSFLMILI